MPVKKYQDPTQTKLVKRKELKTPNSELATKEPASSLSPLLTKSNEGSKPFDKKYTNDYLKSRWTNLSGRIMDWLLEGERLEQMMAESRLKDVGVFAGIAMDKVLLLSGQPTQIVGQMEQKKMEELLPVLLSEVKRRGSLVELTERKASIALDEKK